MFVTGFVGREVARPHEVLETISARLGVRGSTRRRIEATRGAS